jgi:SPOR domain
VVNLASGSFAGTLRALWGFDLPTVLGERTLLVREGGDIVARDLGREGFPETGRIRGGAADLYLPVPWAPAGTQPEAEAEAPPAEDDVAAPVEDSLPTEGAPPEEEINYYLQISRSQNPDWARALVDSLKAEGQPALVLDPMPGEEAYRVVVGPFSSREGAEEAGRRLGRPSFIYQR